VDIIGENNILSCSWWANEGKAVVDANISFHDMKSGIYLLAMI